MAEVKELTVAYDTDHGEVKLTPAIIKKYLVAGDASKVTDQEIVMFMSLCRYQKLNPFLREAYLIKYGTEKATLVTGKETFTKRAAASALCSGWEAGVIVKTHDGKIEKRTGTFVIPEAETLLGGWAKVYRKDWNVPMEQTVSLKEYCRTKTDGSPMASWKEKPATMIRKVALVQALRDAMPEVFEGMYSPEEMAVDVGSLSEAEVKIDNEIETEANADVIDVDPEEEGEQASLDIPEEPKKSKPKF
jgi:phage recombination protein Bet